MQSLAGSACPHRIGQNLHAAYMCTEYECPFTPKASSVTVLQVDNFYKAETTKTRFLAPCFLCGEMPPKSSTFPMLEL
jgi:hypothetical protein